MSPAQSFVRESCLPAPVHRAFIALIGFGMDMLVRVQAAIRLADTTHLPRRFARAPATAEQRLSRTLDWIAALARTMAGDRTWLIVPTYIHPRFPGRYPALTAQLRKEIGLPPIPPRTEAQKAAAHRRYVKKVFATQPVAKIAARLARRLGIPQTHDAWPTPLLTITQPPATYALPSPSPCPSPSSPSWGGPGWGAAGPNRLPPDPPRPATGPPRVESRPEPRL